MARMQIRSVRNPVRSIGNRRIPLHERPGPFYWFCACSLASTEFETVPGALSAWRDHCLAEKRKDYLGERVHPSHHTYSPDDAAFFHFWQRDAQVRRYICRDCQLSVRVPYREPCWRRVLPLNPHLSAAVR